jgi:hypothetical protein
MRPDMDKVIVERPRFGSRLASRRKGKARQDQRLGYDGLPGREGIKRRGGSQKQFNEHLGPLKRYLFQQVGRPWNLVFSEICQRINRNSVVQDHVRDHVNQLVAREVLLIDGVPCEKGGRTHGQPLSARRWRDQFYVCPRTGLLRRCPEEPSRKKRRHKEQAKPAPVIKVGKQQQCRQIEGHWCLVEVRPLPPAGVVKDNKILDAVLNRPVANISPEEAERFYQDRVFALSYRRLNRDELPQMPIPIDLWR